MFTYGGYFPGPVLRARSGRPVQVLQFNGLDKNTSVHLHGAFVAQEEDDGRPADGSEIVQIGSDDGLLERPNPTAGRSDRPGERRPGRCHRRGRRPGPALRPRPHRTPSC
ncbi:multicopper oxidase domain-containing protein [Streptomyces sp. NPDC001816]|uniref:multicopper oxidase domain-containing protein n=1 Tax=Streptomyces sp. NPDC001816 TaxID=3364612 RepID=UPI00369DD4EA